MRLGVGLGLGGGRVPFSPARVPGLVFDFDADAGVTLGAVSGTVEQVANQAPGATVHLAQALATAQPALVTNAVNGHSALEFDGVDDLLVGSGTVAPKHVFVVAVYDLAAFDGFDGLVTLTDTTAAGIILIGRSTTNIWYDETSQATVCHVDGAAKAETAMAVDPLTSWHVTSLSYATGWSGTLQVGQDRNNAARFWDGKLTRLLGYDRVLGAAERQAVEGYLRGRYATP